MIKFFIDSTENLLQKKYKIYLDKKMNIFVIEIIFKKPCNFILRKL